MQLLSAQHRIERAMIDAAMPGRHFGVTVPLAPLGGRWPVKRLAERNKDIAAIEQTVEQAPIEALDDAVAGRERRTGCRPSGPHRSWTRRRRRGVPEPAAVVPSPIEGRLDPCDRCAGWPCYGLSWITAHARALVMEVTISAVGVKRRERCSSLTMTRASTRIAGALGRPGPHTLASAHVGVGGQWIHEEEKSVRRPEAFASTLLDLPWSHPGPESPSPSCCSSPRSPPAAREASSMPRRSIPARAAP